MKRIIAIFLIVLLGISQSGVVLAGHYCMGSLADLSIGFSTQADACDMASLPQKCDSHSKSSISKGSCCSDDFVQLQSDTEFQSPSSLELDFNQDFIFSWIASYLNWDLPLEENNFELEYSPPLLSENRPILFQTFLI